MTSADKPATPKPEKVKGPVSYFPSIEKTYGQPIAHEKALVRSSPLIKPMELINWLKAEHSVGDGHATAVVLHTLAEYTP